jgi:hypothetical protein
MNTVVRACALPQPSLIAAHLAGASFADSHETALRPEDQDLPAMALALRIFSRVPVWIELLMRLRNRAVGLLGLKNQGSFQRGLQRHKAAADYRVGDRLGLFSVLQLSPAEAIIGVADKHLDVWISVCKSEREGQAWLSVSTVVHEHNRLGRIYMFFVQPAHKIIAPATLRHGYP